MNRIVIICEGETEQEFCQKVLYPFFAQLNIYINAPLIKHSNGGIVKWSILKKQIENTLFNEHNVIVTLLIDYYGLYQKYEFPKWNDSTSIVDKNERMDFLEEAMKADIDEKVRYRFIPYIQLHEFEGLLFCDSQVFQNVIPPADLVGLSELQEVVSEYPNPEMINTAKETSPSHRLLRIINGYNKIVYGNILAESIGLPSIRSKCPRFNSWLSRLEKAK